jgi:hypothetical protein
MADGFSSGYKSRRSETRTPYNNFVIHTRQSIKIGNRSFESVAKFKYLGTTLNRSKLYS